MDIWKPNVFCAIERLFLCLDLWADRGILVPLMLDCMLSFWIMPILQPAAKQSIELSDVISSVRCRLVDIVQVFCNSSYFPVWLQIVTAVQKLLPGIMYLRFSGKGHLIYSVMEIFGLTPKLDDNFLIFHQCFQLHGLLFLLIFHRCFQLHGLLFCYRGHEMKP